MNFDTAFDRVVPIDGNYSGGYDARSGEHRFGLRKKDFPTEDFSSMTREQARGLYFTGVWVPAGCALVPTDIRLPLFAAAAVSGPDLAIKMLQRAAGAKEDGRISISTLQAVTNVHPTKLATHLTAHRLLHLVREPGWEEQGVAWVRRIADDMLDL